jgi:hypothetical protein
MNKIRYLAALQLAQNYQSAEVIPEEQFQGSKHQSSNISPIPHQGADGALKQNSLFEDSTLIA